MGIKSNVFSHSRNQRIPPLDKLTRSLWIHISRFCKTAFVPKARRKFRFSNGKGINVYAKDGVPGRSELYVVLTIILCGTNFLI